MTPNFVFLQKSLKEKNLDGFIVTNPVNIFYLCGFRGISPAEREAILIFSPKATLITAKLYKTEALKLQSKGLKIAICDERNKISDLAVKILKGAKSIGFEEGDLKFSEYRHYKKALQGSRLVPVKNFVEEIRVVKSEDELKKIEKAQIISQKAFAQIIKTLKIGQQETQIADKLAKIIKSLGGHGLAFESIIASGKNAALPHHVTGRRKIKRGEVLLFDFGAKYKDYCADLSRTIAVGKVTDDIKNIYGLVEKAQRQVIEKIASGIKSHKPHEHAVDIFKEQHLHDYFLHGLGHGIGLEVHEAPHLRPLSKRKYSKPHEILKENMVFSIEPGLYFPKWGGVRIEDLVVIRNNKAGILGKQLANFIEIN